MRALWCDRNRSELRMANHGVMFQHVFPFCTNIAIKRKLNNLRYVFCISCRALPRLVLPQIFQQLFFFTFCFNLISSFSENSIVNSAAKWHERKDGERGRRSGSSHRAGALLFVSSLPSFRDTDSHDTVSSRVAVLLCGIGFRASTAVTLSP